jgi:hypothetical protein
MMRYDAAISCSHVLFQVTNLSDVKVGRLNLLTPQRVKASVADIDTGEMVRLE